jgi:hypothetical protein
LADAEPECPVKLSDRQQDIAEPLLAIADCLGGEWPTRARRALLALFSSPAAEDTSSKAQLLKDIKDVFEDSHVDTLRSEDLIQKLVEIETSPWAEWRQGRPLTVHGLAALLKPFKIKPRTIRIGDETKKGYLREAFEPDWERYVSGPKEPYNEPSQDLCDDPKIKSKPNGFNACYGVTVQQGGMNGAGLPRCQKCGSFYLFKESDGGYRCPTCEPREGDI